MGYFMGTLPILFHDETLLVVDKPAGVAVHGGSGIDPSSTLLALLPTAGLTGWQPAHRLDAATSGLLVLSNPDGLAAIHAQFLHGTIDKTYLALVQGGLQPSSGHFSAPLSRADPADADAGRRKVEATAIGRPATTDYRTVTAWRQASLVSLTPRTGRTHQLRVHCRHAGHPIAGDPRYGNATFNRLMRRRYGLTRLFLHAAELRLRHPRTGRAVHLESPLPPELAAVVAALGPAPGG
ncbi:MAG: RluA family pseudouridine synthase [Nitrospirota bacterium]|jgi:23S rRNA pseudouridine955/2504/2580 synthase